MADVAFDGHPPAAAPAFIGTVIAQQRVRIVGQPEVVPVIHPLLLNELKLTAEIGVHDHHDHAVVAVVSCGVVDPPVWQASPKNTTPVTECARYVERVRSFQTRERFEDCCGAYASRTGTWRRWYRRCSQRPPTAGLTPQTGSSLALRAESAHIFCCSGASSAMNSFALFSVGNETNGAPLRQRPANFAANASLPSGNFSPSAFRYELKDPTFWCSFRYAMKVPFRENKGGPGASGYSKASSGMP